MQQTDILWFHELGIGDRPVAGGKGASLGELQRAGLPIPPGFVVTTHAFTRFLAALESHFPVRARITDLQADRLDRVQAVGAEIRAAIEQQPLPAATEDAILESCLALGGQQALAVRSSATSEDSEEASFAGLQDTYLWIKDSAQLLDRVRACWASLYSSESLSYRLRLQLPEDQLAMGVVVQRMVDARTAGVMFTRSPTTGDRSVITLEACWGLGSALVSGEVTPDRFVINKVTGEISIRDIATKLLAHVPAAEGGTIDQELSVEKQTLASLSDAELHALAVIGRDIERHYGAPQDIEWAIDQDGTILLLQSRPETVWASKQAVPAAKPAANPFDHIFSALGGQKR